MQFPGRPFVTGGKGAKTKPSVPPGGNPIGQTSAPGTAGSSREIRLEDAIGIDEEHVPLFVRKCVDFIETRGINLEGLYRVPGNQAHVNLLEKGFMDDPNVDFEALEVPVNAVATALKNYFSYLVEPVVPYSMYDELIQAMSLQDPVTKVGRLRDTLKRLPKINLGLLKFFIRHLRKVAQHAHENSMDHINLGKCWWPTLLRPRFETFEDMAQMTNRLENFVVLLLDRYEVLLEGKPITYCN